MTALCIGSFRSVAGWTPHVEHRAVAGKCAADGEAILLPMAVLGSVLFAGILRWSFVLMVFELCKSLALFYQFLHLSDSELRQLQTDIVGKSDGIPARWQNTENRSSCARKVVPHSGRSDVPGK